MIITAMQLRIEHTPVGGVLEGWRCVDFAAKTAEVSPKRAPSETWEWYIKYTDRGTFPLMAKLIGMLAEHQASQPEGHLSWRMFTLLLLFCFDFHPRRDMPKVDRAFRFTDCS